MPDREKVFDALRNCITEPKCRDCPWEDCERVGHKKTEVPVTLLLDALELLKEQEPTKPISKVSTGTGDKKFMLAALNCAIDIAFATNCELVKIPVDEAIRIEELLKEKDVVWTRRSSFWIDETAIDDAYLKYRCQRCGKQSPEEIRFPFCPWCGAKMDEEEQKEEQQEWTQS